MDVICEPLIGNMCLIEKRIVADDAYEVTGANYAAGSPKFLRVERRIMP
jgi:hypothetical protein